MSFHVTSAHLIWRRIRVSQLRFILAASSRPPQPHDNLMSFSISYSMADSRYGSSHPSQLWLRRDFQLYPSLHSGLPCESQTHSLQILLQVRNLGAETSIGRWPCCITDPAHRHSRKEFSIRCPIPLLGHGDPASYYEIQLGQARY